jgi:uncharacterized Fe-S cluster protein YjdI
MAGREIVKRYSNEEITVIWKPEKCIHSGICINTLPKVYNPDARPWIKPENATGRELQQQIETCPSGALSYSLKKSEPDTTADQKGSTRVEVLVKGPLLVHGNIEVTLANGSRELRKRSTAFCRCGASGNKPYCDGTHNSRDFEG